MKRIKTLTAVVLALATTALWGCGKAAVQQSSQESPASSQSSTSSAITAVANPTVRNMLEQPLRHQKITLPVTPILQMPELPTGCESVSLAMVLNTIGFPTQKTELADNYMPVGNGFVTTFKGDPHNGSGFGIYPPGTVRMADNFIQARQARAVAVDLSGMPLEALYHLIDHGCPVVIWTTGGLHTPVAAQGDDAVETYQGKEYRWYNNIHCVVLSGFDTQQETVVVNDPLFKEPKIYDAAQFEAVYDGIDRMAMTVIAEKEQEAGSFS